MVVGPAGTGQRPSSRDITSLSSPSSRARRRRGGTDSPAVGALGTGGGPGLGDGAGGAGSGAGYGGGYAGPVRYARPGRRRRVPEHARLRVVRLAGRPSGSRPSRWPGRRRAWPSEAGRPLAAPAGAEAGGAVAGRLGRVVGGKLGRDRQADSQPPGLVLQRPQAPADQPGGLDPLHPQLAVEPVDHLAAHPADLLPQRGHVLGQPALQLPAQVDLQLQLVLAAGGDLLLQLDLVRAAQLQRGAGITGRGVRLPPARGRERGEHERPERTDDRQPQRLRVVAEHDCRGGGERDRHRGDQRERAQAAPAAGAGARHGPTLGDPPGPAIPCAAGPAQINRASCRNRLASPSGSCPSRSWRLFSSCSFSVVSARFTLSTTARAEAGSLLR